jgi:hypothetical protein
MICLPAIFYVSVLAHNPPNAGVLYLVRKMLSKSFDAIIVMQIIIYHSYF